MFFKDSVDQKHSIRVQKKKIKNYSDDEKTDYLIYLYINHSKSIEYCCEVFQLPLEFLKDYLESLNLLGRQSELKRCNKCGEIKFRTSECFNHHKNTPDDFDGICISCKNVYRKDHKEEIKEWSQGYYQENKEFLLANQKIYNDNHKEEASERGKLRYEENKEPLLKKMAEYYQNNRDYRLQVCADYYQNNKEKVAEYHAGYYEENKEFLLNQQKEYQQNNPEKVRENKKKYRENNRDTIRALDAKHRCSKRNATPPWVDLKAIRNVYKLAKELEAQDGITRHVDHIHPIQSDIICGLHVYQNLQILTEFENLSKGNKFRSHILDGDGNIVEYL